MWCLVEIMAIENALYSVQLFQSIKRYAFNNFASFNLNISMRTASTQKIDRSPPRWGGWLTITTKTKQIFVSSFIMTLISRWNFVFRLFIYNQKILLLVIIYIYIREFLSLKKKKKITIPKFSQFTKYSEKIIFPDNISRE